MNSTNRALSIIILCTLLSLGQLITFTGESSSANTVSLSYPSLAIYPPPAIAADDHLYSFLIQAQDAQGNPLDANATVYLSSSDPEILKPTLLEMNIVDGQGVFYANSTNAGSVNVYAGAQGFLPSSVTLDVVSAIQSSPYTLKVVSPATAIQGEQVPIIIESQGAGGSPMQSSLSFELSSSPLGGNISTAPSVMTGSFQGGPTRYNTSNSRLTGLGH